MGADGGSIAKRSELVKEGDKTLTENPNELWTLCALSHERLQDPVVSDCNGSLYNKTAVLALLLGEFAGRAVTAIAQIRDVVELHRDIERGHWMEPISGKNLETEGFSEKFAYLAECGHIAPANVLVKGSHCPLCEIGYRDMVIINPRTADSRQRNAARIERLLREGLSNSLRPAKKPAKRKRSSPADEFTSKRR